MYVYTFYMMIYLYYLHAFLNLCDDFSFITVLIRYIVLNYLKTFVRGLVCTLTLCLQQLEDFSWVPVGKS